MTGPPAGWYPDPWRSAGGAARWWDGNAWGATWPPPPDPRQLVARERAFAGWARVAVIGQCVGAAAVLPIFVRMVALFTNIARQPPVAASAPPDVVFGQLGVTGVDVVVFVLLSALSPLATVAIIMLMIWTHRAVSSAIALGLPAPRSATMATAGWIVPIVNYWWPWTSLRAAVPEHDPARAALLWWWVSYLTAAHLVFVVVGLTIVAPAAGVAAALVAAALYLVAAVAGMRAVAGVTAAHEQLLAG